MPYFFGSSSCHRCTKSSRIRSCSAVSGGNVFGHFSEAATIGGTLAHASTRRNLHARPAMIEKEADLVISTLRDGAGRHRVQDRRPPVPVEGCLRAGQVRHHHALAE